jgi:hypothetical protein
MTKAFEGILATSGDIFGIFSSGPPQAYPNIAFYWADIFHYRRTYQFPFVLYQRARAALEGRLSPSVDDVLALAVERRPVRGVE